MTKRYTHAITFGRFNLLHRGHLDLFKQMGESAREVLVGVSTGSKNLMYRMRSEVILTAIKNDPGFDFNQYQIFPKKSPFGMFDLLKDVNPEGVVVYLGHDQFELGKTLSREYGCASVTIPRLTSSTTIRALIDNEEWAMLSKEVPSSILHQVVLLREQECQSSH